MVSRGDKNDQEKQEAAAVDGGFHPESLVIALIVLATVVGALVRLFA